MIVRVFATVMILLGMAGFFTPFWIGGVVENLGEVEMPLVDIQDVAVSPDGGLYFALGFGGRVQQYSPTGEFVRGIDFDSAGGASCVHLGNEVLTVYVARRDEADEFSPSGELLRAAVPISESDYQASCSWDPQVSALERRVDAVAVSLTGVDGPVVIGRKVWHYLLPGHFYSWLIGVLGFVSFPEWRRAVFGSFARALRTEKSNRPKSRILRLIDGLLNIVLTLYALTIAFFGLLIFRLAIFAGDDNEVKIFPIALTILFVAFTVVWIWRLWTAYDDEIRFGFTSFKVSPTGAVALKAFSVIFMIAFIFLVFRFGEREARETYPGEEGFVLPAPEDD